MLIEARGVGDRLPRVLGSTRELKSLGAVEGGRVAGLALLLGVDLRSRSVNLFKKMAGTRRVYIPP